MSEQDRPAPYRVAERREWIVCEEPACAGLAILVRTSITNAEQAELNRRHDEIAGPLTERWLTTPAADRDLADSPRARERTLLAEYVLDWNAVGMTEGGEDAPIPPPAVAGPEAFDAIAAAEYEWISTIVLIGYLATGKAGGWQPRPGLSGSRSGPQIVPDTAAA